jgi:hypothetical protein
MNILEHKMLFINVFAVISRITNTLHPDAIFYENELQLINEIKKQIGFDYLPLVNECERAVTKQINPDDNFIALGNAVVNAVENIELSSEYEKFILSFDNVNQNIALATLLRMVRRSNKRSKNTS